MRGVIQFPIYQSIEPPTYHVTQRTHQEVVETRRVRKHQVAIAPVVVQEGPLMHG